MDGKVYRPSRAIQVENVAASTGPLRGKNRCNDASGTGSVSSWLLWSSIVSEVVATWSYGIMHNHAMEAAKRRPVGPEYSCRLILLQVHPERARPFPSPITRCRVSPEQRSADRVRPGDGWIAENRLICQATRPARVQNHATTPSGAPITRSIQPRRVSLAPAFQAPGLTDAIEIRGISGHSARIQARQRRESFYTLLVRDCFFPITKRRCMPPVGRQM
jgi:hypothetical protein